MLGVILGLTAALGFGASSVFARLGLQHLRSSTVTLLSLIVGTTITMSIAFALHSGEIFALSGVAFLWFLLLGAITFPLGRYLNYTGVSLAGVSRASAIIGASPMFAVILAVTITGESVNAPILLGTVFIIGGLALILSQR